MKKSIFFSILLCSSLLISSVWGQDKKAEPVAQAGASAAQQATPQRAAFDAKLAQYKTNLKALRALKDEYQTATPKRKDEIFAKFNPLVKETEGIHRQLIPLAITAYKATGGKDTEVAAFLYGMLQWMTVAREDYETAYSIAKTVLTDSLPPELDVLYAFGAFAAFNVMELDDAKAWFDIAGKKNAIEKADSENKLHLREAIMMALPQYKKFWEDEQKLRAADASQNLPRVLLKTTKGDIVIELFSKEAPNAVNNFLTLVSKGFYNDTPFHRVLPYFMAQGGDPTGTGTGGPGYTIPCECGQDNARMHFRGSLSMAHAGPDTGGSQFFLTFVPTFFLNKKHTVFGRVVEGMNVLSDIQRIDPEGENLPAPDKILEAKILQGKPGEFKKSSVGRR